MIHTPFITISTLADSLYLCESALCTKIRSYVLSLGFFFFTSYMLEDIVCIISLTNFVDIFVFGSRKEMMKCVLSD